MDYLAKGFLFVIVMLFFGCEDMVSDGEFKTVANNNIAPDYYTEKHRPQFHFTPEANWR